jgi:hypothetical protein
MNKLPALCVLSMMAVPVLASCGGDQDASSLPAPPGRAAQERTTSGDVQPTDRTSGVPRIDAQQLVAAFGYADYRYIEFDETETMAEDSLTDVGLTGSVLGFRRGPQLWTDGGPNSGLTVIMKVSVLDEITGDKSKGDIVDVLLPAHSPDTAANLAESLPAGASVALYLNDVPPSEVPATAPAGLLTPVTPQGFIVGDGVGEGVVYPMAHEIVPDQSLDEQVPVGTEVP